MTAGYAGKDVLVKCLSVQGIVTYDDSGIPTVFRWTCKDRKCCPRVPGKVAVHRFVLHGTYNGLPQGSLTQEYEPTRSLLDLVDIIPETRITRRVAGEDSEQAKAR